MVHTPHRIRLERILAGLVMGILFLLPVSTYAYTVSPLVIDRTLKARDIEEVPISIQNTGSSPIRLYTTVNEISVDESGTITEFVTPSMADGDVTITSWLAISRQRIEILPGGEHTIPLTIKMSPTVLPGEYHAFIGFAEGSNRPEAQAAVVAGGVPGVVLRIEVTEDSVTLLRLSRFFIDRFVTNSSAGSAQITLTNSGTKDVTPSGEIIFYNTTGEEVAAAPFNTESSTLSPGVKQDFTIAVPAELGFGKYKAFLDIGYGGTQTAQLQDTTFFYVVPIYQLIALFVGLLVVALVLALRIHRRYAVSDDTDLVGTVPLTVRRDLSEAKDHDINLKNPQ